MLLDLFSCFSFQQTVPSASSSDPVASRNALDLRLNRGLGDNLKIFAMITGAPLTSGKITTKVMTCDTESGSYEEIASSGAVTGNTLIAIAIPDNHKRFVKLHYVKTGTLNRAVEVYAGLVPETEINETLKLQKLNVPVSGTKGNAGIEDLDA